MKTARYDLEKSVATFFGVCIARRFLRIVVFSRGLRVDFGGLSGGGGRSETESWSKTNAPMRLLGWFVMLFGVRLGGARSETEKLV